MPRNLGLWLAIYYLIGLAISIRALLASDRKPADRLSLPAKLGVWANMVSVSALLWRLLLIAKGVNFVGGRGTPDQSKAPDVVVFSEDTSGTTRLARNSRVNWVGLTIFTAIPPAIVVGCWLQERRLTGLF